MHDLIQVICNICKPCCSFRSRMEPYQFSCSFPRIFGLGNPISSVVRIYVYSGFRTLSVQLFVYTYVRTLKPYQFSCSYIRIFGLWNPICSVVRIYIYSGFETLSVWRPNRWISFRKIKVFGSEHAESAIGVSNSLEDFRGTAELMLKVYLSMETKIGGFP